MLRNLIRKDLLLNGKMFVNLLWLLVWAVYASGVSKTPAMMAGALAALVTTVVTVSFGTREDRFHATAVVFSLPVTRRAIVLQRYLLGHVIGYGTLLLSCLLMLVMPWSGRTVAEILDVKSLILVTALISTTIAFTMPLVLRFGAMGLIVGIGGLQVAGIAAFVAGAAVGALFALRQVSQSIERFVLDVRAAIERAGPMLALLVAVGLLTWLSYRLSIVLVERRDV